VHRLSRGLCRSPPATSDRGPRCPRQSTRRQRHAAGPPRLSLRTIATPPDRPSASAPQEKWTVLYDERCGFCKWILAGLLEWDHHRRLAPRALQSEQAEALLADLSPKERLASWHLISPEGERLSAGAALAPLLRLLPGGRIPAHGVAAFPRFTNRAYGWVASHRTQLSKAVPGALKRRASERVRRAEAGRTQGL
jgi:predicted DCC family thiol-disulfide oxidoreductase YuxK